jgi:hypothetical protein
MVYIKNIYLLNSYVNYQFSTEDLKRDKVFASNLTLGFEDSASQGNKKGETNLILVDLALSDRLKLDLVVSPLGFIHNRRTAKMLFLYLFSVFCF